MRKFLAVLALLPTVAWGGGVFNPPPAGAGTGDALVANSLAQFAPTTSLELKGVISDETGSGALVFATSPTFVTPVLGTPSSGNGSNLTALNATQLTSGTVPTARLGTGTANSTSFLRGDSTWQVIAGGGDALVANPLSQFAATTSSQFKGVISDENAPDGASSKVIMALGSLSIASGKTGTISNTLTFTGTDSSSVDFGAGGTVLYSGGALGTPSSATLTNATGLPIAGLTSSTSTALGVGSLELGAASDTTLARVSAGVVSIEGVNIVTTSSTDTLTNKTLTSPTMTSPVLGTPTSGTLTNATGLPIAGLTASTSTALGVGSIELGHATDTTIARSGAGAITVEGVAVPTISSTNTFTNKFVTPRVTSISSNATWSPNADTDDIYEITAQAADATTISNPSGTPVNGQKLMIRVTGTAARALTWSGSKWRASSDLALPTTTTTTKSMYLGFVYNTAGTGTWDLVAKLDNF